MESLKTFLQLLLKCQGAKDRTNVIQALGKKKNQESHDF